jgi:hypothetical protein
VAAVVAAPPQLYAFDKATGKQVGAVNVPSVNSAVPMTFLYQGSSTSSSRRALASAPRWPLTLPRGGAQK